ncbi:MAG: VWA domain-containing protein [Deltaproteobacteria bacterium]|nr:VWA domain-containing protein [Deltaproteobacteria bacterium]
MRRELHDCGPWREALAVTTLFVVSLAALACDRPTTTAPVYKARVRPIEPEPALHVGADQDRVQLLRPELLPPELRGPSQIDAFLQDDAQVDILWVIDNSGTMDNERDRLAAAFTRFIDSLTREQLSFHIGVTTTDMIQVGMGFRGELIGPPTVIDTDTPDPVASFRSHVTMPDSRVQDEQGFSAALAALTEPLISGANAGFLREGADLAVIIVSDEDDNSLGDVDHYARRFKALKGVGNEDTVSVSVVVGERPSGCVSPDDVGILWAEADNGERYHQVAALTGGIDASVCAADYRATLEELGLRFSGLRRIFPLSASPRVATLRVTVDGLAVPRDAAAGWTYDGPTLSIQFLGNYVPPPGSVVEIRYDLSV